MQNNIQYKDGEYVAEGIYAKGKNSINVKLTLSDDTISNVEVTPMATNRMSLGLQKKFAVAVPEVAEGKLINEVHLDRLAGSSLTTQGFNDALEKIKAEASR